MAWTPAILEPVKPTIRAALQAILEFDKEHQRELELPITLVEEAKKALLEND